MLVSDSISKLLNEQVGHEFAAMLQYVAIGAFFDSQALPQLAGFFNAQAEEERQHAQKFVQFLVDVGAPLHLPTIEAPRCRFDTAEQAVQLSLEQEIAVTRQINNLVKQAKDEADFITDNFLQFFVQEQLEEVSSMEDLLATVKRAGEDNLLRVEEFLARNPRQDGGA